MKILILYYTLGGTSKRQADLLAAEYDGADVSEIIETRKRGILTAFVPGCIQAIRRKASAISPLEYNLYDFDRVMIVMPVWASHPAPAFNAVMKLIPAGKEIELFLCSGAGETSKSEAGTRKLVKQRGCVLKRYHNIKADTVSKS